MQVSHCTGCFARSVNQISLQVTYVEIIELIFQKTGYGGEVKKELDSAKIESMNPVTNHQIRVRFNADVSSNMQWSFRPQQTEIRVRMNIFKNNLHNSFETPH